MNFPKNPMDFVKSYSFKDKQEIYTNSSELIPVFRVKQMIEHYFADTGLTPEQVQELKERDTAKEPDYEGDGCDKDGNIIYDTWICPNCGTRYEIEYDDYDFCPRCGQRILKEG